MTFTFALLPAEKDDERPKNALKGQNHPQKVLTWKILIQVGTQSYLIVKKNCFSLSPQKKNPYHITSY